MRFRKVDRYLLLLAALFALAVVRRWSLPGEVVLPEIYRATIHQPLLVPAARALEDPALEAARLRTELDAANDSIARLKQQLTDRDELGRYFETIEWKVPPKAIPAWVLSVEADVYRRFFDIDRGQIHGIQIGMPVVSGKALVGRVHSVGRKYATVRRVDDAGFRIEVAVRAGEESVPGVASGDGDGGLILRFTPDTRFFEPGEPVFSSSYDAQIPHGLLVGYVQEVDDHDRDRVERVTLRPGIALGQLAQVWVLPYERPRGRSR